MAKLIAFSGASNSGKTTTIKRLLARYKEFGYVDEMTRRRGAFDIQLIRESPSEYLDFQYEVIGGKIEEEEKEIRNMNNKVVLVDRSIVDSLFYLSFYVDKSKLSSFEIQKYVRLFKRITHHMDKAPYYKILMFEPISTISLDGGCRSKNLSHFQEIEYFLIRNLTYSCFPKSELTLEIATKDIESLVDDAHSFLGV